MSKTNVLSVVKVTCKFVSKSVLELALVIVATTALAGIAKAAVSESSSEAEGQTEAAVIISSDELKLLLQPLANSTGEFEQLLYDQQGELVQESSGTFALKQPGRFRWDTLEPFPQNLISNGETIWLYDPDLEQVTIKSFADQQDQLPIRLISGDFSVLEAGFDIKRIDDQASVKHQQYLLSPTESDQINNIELSFSENLIQSMSVTETTGFHTIFKFRNHKPIEKLELSAFEFAVPEGSDVFYDN